MAFGIAVPTTNGLESLMNIRAMRLVHKSNRSAKNGSATLATSVVENAIPFARVNDGKDAPYIQIDESTGVVSWAVRYGSTTASTSGDWTLCLYKVV